MNANEKPVQVAAERRNWKIVAVLTSAVMAVILLGSAVSLLLHSTELQVVDRHDVSTVIKDAQAFCGGEIADAAVVRCLEAYWTAHERAVDIQAAAAQFDAGTLMKGANWIGWWQVLASTLAVALLAITAWQTHKTLEATQQAALHAETRARDSQARLQFDMQADIVCTAINFGFHPLSFTTLEKYGLAHPALAMSLENTGRGRATNLLVRLAPEVTGERTSKTTLVLKGAAPGEPMSTLCQDNVATATKRVLSSQTLNVYCVVIFRPEDDGWKKMPKFAYDIFCWNIAELDVCFKDSTTDGKKIHRVIRYYARKDPGEESEVNFLDEFEEPDDACPHYAAMLKKVGS